MSITAFNELNELLADDLAAVNDMLRARMQSNHVTRIADIGDHLINAGGKRIRPMLTLATAQLCQYQGVHHTHLATTVEFIHTATLLHDDVVDNSEQRRGRPSANLLWDNPSSVLVGDYLFSRAFQLMVEVGSLKILDILSNASATIAEGEVLQLSAQNNLNTNEATYLNIIESKTSTLFAAACQVGAVLAEVPEPIETALRNYGMALGTAFQLIDDYLDYAGDPDRLGKQVGDDFRDRKLTLPIIKTLAKGIEPDFWQRSIAKGQQDDSDLEHAMALFKQSNALVETRAMAVDYANFARNALIPLPDSRLKRVLMEMPDFVVKRGV